MSRRGANGAGTIYRRKDGRDCPECDTQLTVDGDMTVLGALNKEGLGVHRGDLFAYASTLA